MNFNFTEHNLEKFYNSHYIEDLKEKLKISLDTYKHLYPFQIRGIQFLFRKFSKNKSCILDYDSQMGKTVIISVLLGSIIHTKSQFHSLIICEEHLINHWYEHIIKWSNFEPIYSKNSKDIEKVQLGDRIIKIVDYELLKEFNIYSWNLIVIDNADKRSIINNRHVKNFKENCKSSMFILLTNATVKQPSKRETLWYLLHFLKAEPAVPSLKKFTSENSYTLRDQLWFPWRNLYQRIGWYIYPEFKDMIKKNSNVLIEKLPKTVYKKTTTKDTIITADDTNLIKHELTLSSVEKNKSLIELSDNYFIAVNKEFLTPRCSELRKLLKPNTESEIINKNNNSVNLSYALNDVDNNLETIITSDRLEKPNIDNIAQIINKGQNHDRIEKSQNIYEFVKNLNNKKTNTLEIINRNGELENNGIKVQNELKKNYRNKFENDFERLISLNKNPKTKSDYQETKTFKSELKKSNIDLIVENREINLKSLKGNHEVKISTNTSNNTNELNISQPIQSKETKLNLLFDKLLSSDEPISSQSHIFKNNDTTIKKTVAESVEKRINTSDVGGDRKKLKPSNTNFKSIELESNDKNIQDSKQRKYNSFESIFDNLISKRK